MQAPGQVPFARENELLSRRDVLPHFDGWISLPDDHLVPHISLEDYLASQLSVRRLDAIHTWLWRAGLPGRAQALHHQKVLRREIVLTERVDLHLVWTNDRIFIKPIPSFLLEHAFFKEHISANPDLLPSARGFLHTYTKLIKHRTDFNLSQELGLLPPGVTWAGWNRFRMDLQTSITHSYHVDKRYRYGELRLSRLNQIYRFRQRSWRGGYFLIHTQYQSFFAANFEWLLLAFAYMSVALSALQVLLAADQGYDDTNKVLRGLSLAVGSTSIISVLLTVVLIAALFGTLRIVNEAFARGKRADVQGDFELNDFKTFVKN
ncbi:MAG: hypothetical protein Q9193_002449 [Seirophora villosa]